ncbi:MAG: hypothetical protein KF773_18430 [Deltaproteobacteria bacterium]|nr:hypothetical protein [Deltaproteobacteria bacterium]MCW5806748.1 hypothetical protein [Deltaproteobacteria bacterium]
MQPNLAASYRARFLGLGALLIAGIVVFLTTRPPSAPDEAAYGARGVGRCMQRR